MHHRDGTIDLGDLKFELAEANDNRQERHALVTAERVNSKKYQTEEPKGMQTVGLRNLGTELNEDEAQF